MEENLKQLLLKDLSARLRHGLIVEATYKDGEGWKTEDRKLKGIYDDGQVYLDCVYTNIENIKPYLRPMSSMTEEEESEYWIELHSKAPDIPIGKEPTFNDVAKEATIVIDWLNKHRFDYRGLIPMGLAMPARKGMYK